MLYKAIVSFSGNISMTSGQIREISDESLVNDLMKAGYIIKQEADKKPKADDVPDKPKTKRKGKNNED